MASRRCHGFPRLSKVLEAIMRQQMKGNEAGISGLAVQLCLLSVALTMIGCQAVRDRDQTVASPGVQTGQAQRALGPIVGSDKIMSDMRAAGFSVADPKVQWGVTVVVNAEQTSGGFFADAETGGIALHWAKVADASNYEIFR